MSRQRAFTLGDMRERLSTASALLIGLGGLGSPAALVLARAGVGTLGLVDPDQVEPSNLPRQVLYEEADIGRRKVDVAAERLTRLAPGVRVQRYPQRFTAADATFLADWNVILDGTDTVRTKFLVNDAAVAARVPLIHAGASGWRVQLTTILAGSSACYRCVFEEPPDEDEATRCDQAGILGPAVTLGGTVQASEAVRLLAGRSPLFGGRLLAIDLRAGTWRIVPLARRPDCAACDPLGRQAQRERRVPR